MKIVYFSLTGQTRRFVKKLDLDSYEVTETNPFYRIEEDYVVVAPTYDIEVTELINDFIEYSDNQMHLKGVAGGGNLNFANLFVFTAKDLAKKYNVKGQVGHVERFNPAFTAVKDKINNPMFIETHRLAEFNPRGTDVPVVLDLMIHDIDAILSVVKSKVKSVNASGVAVISDSPDISNARIEFENGCVANITSSRISMKNMRKSRFFQKDAYISVDYLDKVCEVVRMKDAPEVPGDFDMILQNAEGVKKQIYFDNPQVDANNAILDELETFADAINNNTTPIVTLEDGTEALRVAHMIIQSMEK